MCLSLAGAREQQRQQGGVGGGVAGTVAEGGSHVSSARADWGTCRPRRGGGGVASLPADTPPGYPQKCDVPQGPRAPLRHER